MKIKANAKINIALKVVGTRENGYHDLDMIMVPIGLYDVIDIEVLSDEYETNVEFDDYSIPLGPKNTINKAIELLREKYHFKEEFDVYVNGICLSNSNVDKTWWIDHDIHLLKILFFLL